MKPSRTFKRGQPNGRRAWAAPRLCRGNAVKPWKSSAKAGVPAKPRRAFGAKRFCGECYTWKLSPQPQRPFSFGLVKVKPADIAFTS